MKKTAIVCALLAAALYAVNIPLSKLLLANVQPTVLAGMLYLGAGIGMLLTVSVKKLTQKNANTAHLTKKELPYTVAMVLLDIAAPILLMMGIARTDAASVSLLSNFEIVATAVIALVLFREAISKKLWFSILIITLASVLLSMDGLEHFTFSEGSLFAIGACVCWGFENNCTRKLSQKSVEEIVIIKGIFSGVGSIVIALLLRERFPAAQYIFLILLLGFVSYGLSIRFYIMAQKELGAAKTGAFYAIAPFLGVTLGIFLGETPALLFYIALPLMALSTVLMVRDTMAAEKDRR